MAEFCSQCSIAKLGEDYGDLRGLVKEGQTLSTICEGCGFIKVDSTGKCVSTKAEGCLCGHGDKS